MRFINAEVCVIQLSQRLRWITQTSALINLNITRELNPITVLLYLQTISWSVTLETTEGDCVIIVCNSCPFLYGCEVARRLVTTECNNTFFGLKSKKAIIAR